MQTNTGIRGSFWSRLAAIQVKRAGTGVLLGMLLSLVAIPFVLKLGLDSRLEALLPESAPSVLDLKKAENRVSGLSTLIITVHSPGKNVPAMQDVVRTLAPRLAALRGVESVDWNISEFVGFIKEHQYLYAPLEDLREIAQRLRELEDQVRAKKNPLFVDLEDEPTASIGELTGDLEARVKNAGKKLNDFPDGFYLHPDRDLMVLTLRCNLEGLSRNKLLDEVETVVASIGPPPGDLRLGLAGNVIVAAEEQEAISRELKLATSLTMVAVLIAIFIFFRRFRAIALLGIVIIPPTLITFAIGSGLVGALNTSTAFLGSIVIGNGINPCIIWLAGYYEQRQKTYNITLAVARTHQTVWLGTLLAALAAATSYGSLLITSFRGFRDFGILAFIGMVTCWLACAFLLPCLVAAAERIRPLTEVRDGTTPIDPYSRLFSALAFKRPAWVIAIAGLLSAASLVLVVNFLRDGAFEYDFRKLRSERPEPALRRKVYGILATTEQGNGIAVLLPTVEQANDARRWLEQHAHGLWEKVHTLSDRLPPDQEKKLELLGEIRGILEELRPLATDEERAQIDAHIPAANLRPLTIYDLPESVARAYTERNGKRGTILVVEASRDRSTWDGRYLVAWARGLRELRQSDGTRPPLAGRAPVFADMIAAVRTDGPRAVAVALAATALFVMLGFRRLRDRARTLGTLLIGVLWMTGAMAIFRIKLNFLNFVAFPVTFGNGVDYAINTMQRYVRERDAGNPDAIRTAVERTGGAVVLCSLTTVIGYSSLIISANLAINSFGLAMALSEITCLGAAVCVLPAAIYWGKRRLRRSPVVENSDGVHT